MQVLKRLPCLLATALGSGPVLAAVALPIDGPQCGKTAHANAGDNSCQPPAFFDHGFASSPGTLGSGRSDVLGVPTPGASLGTDLRLLSIVWDNHRAAFGMNVQPVPSSGRCAGRECIRRCQYVPGQRLRPRQLATRPIAAHAYRSASRPPQCRHHAVATAGAAGWHPAADTVFNVQYGRAQLGTGLDSPAVASSGQTNPLRRLDAIEAFELNTEQRVGGDVSLRAALYSLTVLNLGSLEAGTIGGLPQVPSGQTVEVRGLELSAERQWAPLGLRLRGAASVQEPITVDGGPLLAAPQWLARLWLSAPLPWAGLRLDYEWLYDADRIAADGRTLGGFAQSNLVLDNTGLAKGLALSLVVQNLLDVRDPRLLAANALDAVEPDRRRVRLRLAYQF